MTTGSFDCEGGYAGLFDMSGNVAEWTADCWDDSGVEVCEIHGSYYACEFDRMACSGFGTNQPDREMWIMGFRCCLELEE